MKYKIILAAFTAAVLFAGCAEDHGNYDYRTLNTIEIDGIDELIEVDQFDYLKIDPKLTFNIAEESDLGFEWVLDGDVISTQRVCNVEITQAANGSTSENSGSYDAYLCVTNNKTDLKYYHPFKVLVGTSFTNALYILSEQSDGTAKLSMQRRDRDRADSPLVHDIFEKNNEEFGILGKKPRHFVKTIHGTVDTDQVYVVCEEGERKISGFSKQTMLLTNAINEDVIEGYDGGFSPTMVYNYSRVGGMALSGGKLFLFNYWGTGTLYKPVNGDCDFTWVGSNGPMAANFFLAHDAGKEQFVVLEPSDGVSFDNVYPIKNGPQTTGQKFLMDGYYEFSGMMGTGYSPQVIMLDNDNTAYLYTLKGEMDYFSWPPGVSATATLDKEIAGILTPSSVGVLANTKYWYISKGNKVSRLHMTGDQLADWYTVPKGDVVSLMVTYAKDKDNKDIPKALLIASYDGTNSYIYEADPYNASKLLTPDVLEMPGRIVDLVGTGTWRYEY